jgi:hypothetical protein
MNKEEMEKLLEKYYSAETSEEEEQMLRSFVLKGDLSPDSFPEKDIFMFYSEEDIPSPSPDFEDRIIAAVGREEKNRRKGLRIKVMYSLSGIAAGVALLAGVYFMFSDKAEPADTFSDPELAYAETIKILSQVSEKMNSGMKGLEPIGKMNSATRLVSGSVSKIEKEMSAVTDLQNKLRLIGSDNKE